MGKKKFVIYAILCIFINQVFFFVIKGSIFINHFFFKEMIHLMMGHTPIGVKFKNTMET